MWKVGRRKHEDRGKQKRKAALRSVIRVKALVTSYRSEVRVILVQICFSHTHCDKVCPPAALWRCKDLSIH